MLPCCYSFNRLSCCACIIVQVLLIVARKQRLTFQHLQVRSIFFSCQTKTGPKRCNYFWWMASIRSSGSVIGIGWSDLTQAFNFRFREERRVSSFQNWAERASFSGPRTFNLCGAVVVAQRLECRPVNWKVMGLHPVAACFFFVPCQFSNVSR